MTAFDIAAGLVLLVSALIGLFRGAVRELVTFFAFAFAATAAVFLLPLSAPIARHTIHPAWAAKILAVLVVFLAVYIAVRLLAGALSAALHRQATLGALDRTAGLGLGVVRGLVVLGAFYLVFTAATPPELKPQWIVGASLYPLSRVSGRALAAVAPRGMRGMGGVRRTLGERFAASGDRSGDTMVAAPPADDPAAPYEPRRDDGRHRRRTLVIESDATPAR